MKKTKLLMPDMVNKEWVEVELEIHREFSVLGEVFIITNTLDGKDDKFVCSHKETMAATGAWASTPDEAVEIAEELLNSFGFDRVIDAINRVKKASKYWILNTK